MAQWKYITAPPDLWSRLLPLAKEMRHKPTEAEDRLWQRLRRKALGEPFRRQHPMGAYIVDFVCLKKCLVVEVDGPIHDPRRDHDQNRDAYLAAIGFRVLRFTNAKVMNNIDEVLETIGDAIGQ